MVAITVILAAVIGTFVLGLGDQVQTTAPNTNIAADQSNTTYDDSEFITLELTHDGGDTLSEDNIEVTVNGNEALREDDSQRTAPIWDGTESISAGSSATVVAYWTGADDFGTGDDISVADGGDIDGDADYDDPNTEALVPGDTVRVIWTSDDGGSSSTIFTRDIR